MGHQSQMLARSAPQPAECFRFHVLQYHPQKDQDYPHYDTKMGAHSEIQERISPFTLDNLRQNVENSFGGQECGKKVIVMENSSIEFYPNDKLS